MRELLVFFIIACLAAAILLVSLVELIFTIRRRKAQESLTAQLKELRAAYNESVNSLVLEGDSKLTEADKQLDEIHADRENLKVELTNQYEQELELAQEKAHKALAKAEEKAHKLEAEATLSAEHYLEQRKKEVEGELMDLVMKVVKKVLPDGLTYEIQKELVTKALNEVKLGAPHDH